MTRTSGDDQLDVGMPESIDCVVVVYVKAGHLHYKPSLQPSPPLIGQIALRLGAPKIGRPWDVLSMADATIVIIHLLTVPRRA